ncbi:unnamed protein product [Adineta ricciae]|uniref:Uncharacterized protein n=1 Tax=Adineta ricciae TaxID=249248 RepID=A0A815VJS0_ADIRI|nr:unnamed protein product [Adineta ricciae]CAF1529198.1 unnamed protein product [Adineta ricciae]
MNNITLAIIASSVFGKDFQSINQLLRILEYRAMCMINDIFFIGRLPFWSKNIINKCPKDISDRRHKKSMSLSSNEDLLDLLLSEIDNQEVKDQALTFVLA